VQNLQHFRTLIVRQPPMRGAANAHPGLQRALMTAARETHKVRAHRRTNRAYARTALKPLFPALLFGYACVVMLQNVVKLIESHTFKHRPGRSRPRPGRPKPYKHMAYKAC
jgi:hypothetical protein